MDQLTITLRDINPGLAKAWKKCFGECPNVTISSGHIFDISADAVVSPANSLGFMDAGIDAVYAAHFGQDLMTRVQDTIKTKYHGILLVGQATVIPTKHDSIKYMISAPTMEVPRSVHHTTNAYLAFRAALYAVLDHNKTAGERGETVINTLLCPGLCTAIGRMSPKKCAFQMHCAYKEVCGAMSIFGEPAFPVDATDAKKAFWSLAEKGDEDHDDPTKKSSKERHLNF
eukprot:TRINITY_DN6416_c0_g1_i1.p1 TRINITY_DN6416_c0_g1~~TRINITY_DN6416_c0_g1_i1.p1  ORF type:complete len:229 (+),score=56.07 TRINITY_DN6416_c0_g1_i1:81-767(+)